MNEEQFIKEHPGLEGSVLVIMHTTRDLIHETQLDKIKHKEIMDKREHTYQINLKCAREGAKEEILQKVNNAIESNLPPSLSKDDLKRELGLE